MLERVLVAVAGTVVFLACGPAPIGAVTDKEKLEADEDEKDGKTQCTSQSLSGLDASSLAKCACRSGGSALCVPKNAIPSSFASKLEACDDGVCIPEKLVESGGAAPKTCKSIAGEGRCMSLCVPDVAKKKDLLNRGKSDECDEEERCVPCTNPLDGNKPTGVCDIGKAKVCKSNGGGDDDDDGDGATCPYKGEPIDVSGFPACGTGGRCVPEDAVSPAQRPSLERCAKGLCAPEKSVKARGMHLPTTCRSIAGAEGRCLSKVIKDIAAKADRLSQDKCDANELCAPCFDPTDGKETGACSSVTCDAPKEQPKSFPLCCEGKGRCVPEASVTDPDQKEKLEPKECTGAAELCAPAEDVTRAPGSKRQSCTGTMRLLGSAYTGACVSNCLALGIRGIFIEQGSCDAEHTCAPCVDPLGRNTGACD
jgi:hypothetical protein